MNFWTLNAGDAECWSLLTVYCDWNQSVHNNGIIDHWPSFLCRCLQSLHCHEKYFRNRKAIFISVRGLICPPLPSEAWCAFGRPRSLSDLQAKIMCLLADGLHSSCFICKYKLKEASSLGMNGLNSYTGSCFNLLFSVFMSLFFSLNDI